MAGTALPGPQPVYWSWQVALPLATALCAVGWLGVVADNMGMAVAAAAVTVALPLGYGTRRVLAFALRKLDAKDFFSPWIAFPLAYVLWFGFGTIDFVDDPAHVLYGMFDPMPAAIMGYAALGLAGYLAGVWVCSRSRDAGWPSPAEFQNRWRPPALRAVLKVFFVLMLASYFALVVRMGIPLLSASAAEDRLAVGNYGPTQSVLLCSAWTLMALLPASYWLRQLGKRAAGAGVTVVSVLLLSMGGRGNFCIGCLTLLIARHYLKRRIRMRTVLVGTLALFAGCSAYGFLRDTAFRDTGSFAYLEQIGIPPAVQPLVYAFTYVRGTVATFRDITGTIPAEVPYQYGRLTLLPLSTLLPGHHEMADMFFKNILGHDFVGLGQPATPLGPLYGDFGGWGIVAGMFVFGMVCGRLYRSMRRRPATLRALVYAWTMQAGLFGLFGSLFPYITTLFIPLLWLALDRFLALPPPRLEAVIRGKAECQPTP